MANKPDKGKRGGSCNRTACQAPHSAFCEHRLNQGDHYCLKCARLINDANMDYDGQPIVMIPANYADLFEEAWTKAENEWNST